MAVVYPIRVEAPEDSDGGYEDFAEDLSDIWVVQVRLVDRVGEELEAASFGPLPPEEAWDLAHDVDDAVRRKELTVELEPVFPYRTQAEVLDFLFADNVEEPEDLDRELLVD